MNGSITRWKIVGVAAGAASLVAGGTAAYACLPGGTAVASAQSQVAQLQTHDRGVFAASAKRVGLRVAAAHAVDWIAAITSRLEDKTAALGSPATLTPEQPEHVRHTISFVSFLQDKVSELSAAGVSGADVLATRLATVKAKLATLLANASVVQPTVSSTKPTDWKTGSDFASAGAFDPTGHHCDHNWAGDPGSGTWDHHDYRGGSFGGYDHHHDFRR